MLRDRRYGSGIGERLGFLPDSFQRTVPDAVWLHAVSVGEVLSAVELIRQLRRELPGSPVFVSCTTLAGREAAHAKLTGLADGVFFAPVDMVWIVRRVLRRIRPAVVVVLETEIWLNLYRETKRAGSGLVIVNGRISDKAWPSYQKWARFFAAALEFPDRILVQSEEQRRRYVQVGAPPERVAVAGNLKYDFNPRSGGVSEPVARWLASTTGPLWIAASTVAPEFEGDCDEDDAVLAAWSALRGVRLLIAPRKPERFDIVAGKLDRLGIRYARRTRLPENEDAPVLLLDSIGELGAVFVHADVVFMGGTLAHRGGHNILEPAASGRVVICGPHLENFAEIQAAFRAGGGIVEIADAAELGGAVQRVLAGAHADVGSRAQALAEQERGATTRAVNAIMQARWSALPRTQHLGLWLLSRLWLAGGWITRAVTGTERLPVRVVSVGGLVMGGSGKTPVVRDIARTLAADGLSVAVLTRGYRRESAEPVTVLGRGTEAPVRLTGDEAQTILRDGASALGIGADRALAGRELIRRLGQPDLFLLDDGFQHARVARDRDIVVLDGLDPLAGGGVFPLGRMREPLVALRRAHAVIITRAEGRRFDGLLRELDRINPSLTVVLAETEPRAFVNVRTGERDAVETWRGRSVAAFCGLGNPEGFRRTLQTLGVDVPRFTAFPDHHRYSQEDIVALRTTQATLVTTEKDAVKLGEIGEDIWYLEVGLKYKAGRLRGRQASGSEPTDYCWMSVSTSQVVHSLVQSSSPMPPMNFAD